ncbi:MAG: hypothetical protein JST00_22680 [Deltaproteobacteria bacterium]|nr:hypothetical protein [Deltaproteobacteria bacterium]
MPISRASTASPPQGIAFALGALVDGSLFLSVYLLVASLRARGDVRVLLLGDER